MYKWHVSYFWLTQGRHKVSVLRDSGCNTVIVKDSLVSKDQLTNHKQGCTLVDGTIRVFPTACIEVNTPYFVGKINAICMTNPVYDPIIGNITDAKSLDESCIFLNGQKHTDVSTDQSYIDESRVKDNKENKDDTIDKSIFRNFADMVLSQLSDESLAKYRYAAKTGKKRFYKKGAVSWCIKDNGIFFRKYQSQQDAGKVVKQILVPRSQRADVLRAVHGSDLSRHIGVRKTKEKLMFGYWWPGVEKDIRSYCKSCKACHKTVNKGKISLSQLDKKSGERVLYFRM